MARRLITLAVLLGALAALAWSFWPRPIPVETAVVAHRDITVTVEEEGKARIREVFTVSAPISGQTLRIDLHAGDPVVKDETVVASIRPAAPGLLDARLKRVAEAASAAAQASVGLAEAEVKQAEAQLAFGKTELSRAERLSAQGTISASARDKARLEVDTAAAALDSARASLAVRQRELERAQAALIETGTSEGPCCTDIRAPVSGQILALGDGFRVLARITVWEGQNLVAVPVAALFRQGGDWAVYAAVNGRAALRTVSLGRRNGDFAEVTGGLAEGDTVILHPSDQMADGVAVTPVTTD